MSNFECPSYVSFKSKVPGSSSSDQFFHDLILKDKQELNAKFQQIMLATDGVPVGVEFRHQSIKKWAFIVKEMSDIDLGSYRVQMFDEKGFYSHSTFSILDEAIEKLAEDNFTEIDSGVLDEISSLYSWKSGAVSFDIISKVNSGKISYEEGCAQFEAWKLANPDTSAESTPAKKSQKMRR